MPGVADALGLAARGWSVLPVHGVDGDRCSCGRPGCPSPGKHPYVRWERGMTRAATPAEIEAWWERWPDANLGVVTGWVSALLVLDVDPRNGGDVRLVELESRFGALPATVESATGGGGRHLWFGHPTHLLPSRPLAPGLDLKAEGGMVVAPPSRHVSGGVYTWGPGRAPDDRSLAPVPSWLERMAIALGPPTAPAGHAAADRTPAERATFRMLWADVGVDVEAGDVMVRCPFHDDHRPSLHVDADGCRWFCFGCRRGGGIQALRRLVHPEERIRLPVTEDDASGDAVPGRPTLSGEVVVDVVGESFHQDDLLALTGGRRTWSGAHRRVLAELVPREDRPIDGDAVALAVLVEDRPVGNLGRIDAHRYGPAVRAAIAASGRATCLAEIRGGWERDHGDVGRFGVVLFLPEIGGPDPD